MKIYWICSKYWIGSEQNAHLKSLSFDAVISEVLKKMMLYFLQSYITTPILRFLQLIVQQLHESQDALLEQLPVRSLVRHQVPEYHHHVLPSLIHSPVDYRRILLQFLIVLRVFAHLLSDIICPLVLLKHPIQIRYCFSQSEKLLGLPLAGG